MRGVCSTPVSKIKQTFDSFVNRLCKLFASCNYGALLDEMIQDRIVFGIRDNEVRARLLRDSELTLDKAMKTCLSAEITNKQLRSIEGDSIHFATAQKKTHKCKYCGEILKGGQCPAYCKKCGKC